MTRAPATFPDEPEPGPSRWAAFCDQIVTSANVTAAAPQPDPDILGSIRRAYEAVMRQPALMVHPDDEHRVRAAAASAGLILGRVHVTCVAPPGTAYLLRTDLAEMPVIGPITFGDVA